MVEKKKKSGSAAKKEMSENELSELLSPKRGTYLKIQAALQELPEKFCVLLVEKQSDYMTINSQLVKYFLDKGLKGIYVTVNKNASDLVENLDAAGIAANKLVFVDAISVSSGGEKVVGENFYYLDSPKDLVELSVLIERIITKMGKEKKFIILDSLSTLLVYNKAAAVERFVHSLSGKIRASNAQGVLILVEATKKELVETLSQFCDRTAII